MAERDYYGFLDEMVDKLQAVQNPFSSQFRVNVKDVEKANGMSYRGIEVSDLQTGMGVTVNMDKHYKMYLGGKSVDEIAELVQQQVADAFEKRPDVDMSRLKDYESLCSNVMMEAVSREKNAEYLQNIPHFDMADLSIIYRLNVGRDRNHDIGVVTVDNQLLNSMGVSQDQFQKDVLEQALAGEPPILKSPAEVMDMNFMGEDSDPEGGLFLATNRDALYGASVIAIPGFLDQAAEKLGGSFYILPSSIHEVLFLRNVEEVDVRELESMVQEINAAIVSPEEQLSDRVYHYDSQEKVFELASDYELRVAEKDQVELEAAALDKGVGAWSVRGQGIDSPQEEASGNLQDKHSVPETGKEGLTVSDDRTAAKPGRSERKSVLGALQEKKEQAGFICLPGFIQTSSQASGSDSQKVTIGAESGGSERIITLRTADYPLKGRKGLWVARICSLLMAGRFFCSNTRTLGMMPPLLLWTNMETRPRLTAMTDLLTM